ncbi:MAG TPA: hypothetical protein VLM40_13755 [Gemmata sp.]|nr:hypothetical protein [Gemmata sp.]
MASERDILTSESATSNGPAEPHQGEPAFIARARRILAGDIHPDDYLPVTPEVKHRVDLFMDWARARAGDQPPPDPEVEERQLRSELLSFHHGGENLAYIEDSRGVIVLGVGLEQSGEILRNFPEHTQRPIWFGAPDNWNF